MVSEEFAANVYWALHHDPTPLSSELRYTLSWEAATERFVHENIACYYVLSYHGNEDACNDWSRNYIMIKIIVVKMKWYTLLFKTLKPTRNTISLVRILLLHFSYFSTLFIFSTVYPTNHTIILLRDDTFHHSTFNNNSINCRLMAASLVTREMLSKSNKFADQFCKWATDVVRKLFHGLKIFKIKWRFL